MKLLAVRAALACLVLTFVPIAAGAADPVVAERPRLVVGEVFEYAERFQTVACRRWQVAAVGADGSATTRCGDNVATFGPDGALLHILGKNGAALVSYDPQAPAIPFPLRVGSRWESTFEVSTAGDLVTPTIHESCEATAFESVRVPAGDFPAFHIACTDHWRVGFLAGTSTAEQWYAPAAKTVVRARNSGSDTWNLELTGPAPR